MGSVSLIVGEFTLGGIALRGLGDLEGAAVLLGRLALPGAVQNFPPPWGHELLAVAQDGLIEELGAEGYARLAARGAAFDIADAVAFLRARAEPLLPPSPTS